MNKKLKNVKKMAENPRSKIKHCKTTKDLSDAPKVLNLSKIELKQKQP